MTRALPLVLLAAAGLWGCGSDSAAACTPTSGTNAFTGTLTVTTANPPGNTTCQATVDVTFTGTTVSTTTISMTGGSCLRFVNADTVDHWPESDPHPTHTQCPELNIPAPLRPGEGHTTAVLSGPKTCGFHDHLFPPTSACVGGGGGGSAY